jgi:hypothetical protein
LRHSSSQVTFDLKLKQKQNKMAPTKLYKKSIDKTPSTHAKAGRANKITSAISPNLKKNKLDNNTATALSTQSHHHQLTLFW